MIHYNLDELRERLISAAKTEKERESVRQKWTILAQLVEGLDLARYHGTKKVLQDKYFNVLAEVLELNQTPHTHTANGQS